MPILFLEDIKPKPAKNFDDLADRMDCGQRFEGNLYGNEKISTDEANVYRALLNEIKSRPALIPSVLQWMLDNHLGSVPMSEVIRLVPAQPGELTKLITDAKKGVVPKEVVNLQDPENPFDQRVEWYMSLVAVLNLDDTMTLTLMRELLLLSPKKPNVSELLGYSVHKRSTVVFDHFIREERRKTAFSAENWKEMHRKAETAMKNVIASEYEAIVPTPVQQVKRDHAPVFPYPAAVAAD